MNDQMVPYDNHSAEPPPPPPLTDEAKAEFRSKVNASLDQLLDDEDAAIYVAWWLAGGAVIALKPGSLNIVPTTALPGKHDDDDGYSTARGVGNFM